MGKNSAYQVASTSTFWILSCFVFLTLPASLSQLSCSNQHCGSLSNVSFPFSVTAGCPAFSPSFRILCNRRQGSEIPLLNTRFGPFPVLRILDDSLIIDVTSAKAITGPENCTISPYGLLGFNTSDPFVVSSENRFVNVGCQYSGVLYTQNVSDWTGSLPEPQFAGCSVICEANVENEICGDTACCTASIVNDSRTLVYFSNANDNKSCATSFAVPFHTDFTDFDTTIGLKVLWAFPSLANSTDAITATIDYTCSENSDIVLVSQVPGYLCRCKDGFEGDGLSNGSACTDIDECMDAGLNHCIHPSSCRNTIGSYACSCNSKFQIGDGKHGGSGCSLSPILIQALSIIGGSVGVIIGLSVTICSVIRWRKWRRRRNFFNNGGFELQKYISRMGIRVARFFSVEELQTATQNFSEQLKLGAGGFGAVFRGTLNDGRIVAVKKPNRVHEEKEQFINEISILMQINHRHIVQLLGCCLETATPLLVYEFVSNGTLSEHLQAECESKASRVGQHYVPAIEWHKRLQIASQTAEALAYLHEGVAQPILHRDVKSSNILLDDALDAKVADFGVSRLVPDGNVEQTQAVSGTLGYVDPECFQTLQLTDKSDVYSLGVVLVELITGLKAVDNRNREPSFANLSHLFIQRMGEGAVEELIDERLGGVEAEESTRATILRVAALARRCLAMRGGQRPSMREVAEELRLVMKALKEGKTSGGRSVEEAMVEFGTDESEASSFLTTFSERSSGSQPSSSSTCSFVDSLLIPRDNRR